MNMLHAIVNFCDEPYEDTCLCDGHYTQQNIEWHEMNYDGAKSRWMDFKPQLKNPEYAPLNCTICGYPISSE